jgi:hypothetical protein
MQIDYMKISYKEDVHICHTKFTKNWNEIYMEQLADGKCIENNCFLRTLKFEMMNFLGVALAPLRDNYAFVQAPNGASNNSIFI